MRSRHQALSNGAREARTARAKTIAVTDRGLSIIDRVETASREIRNAALVGLSGDEIAAATQVLELVCQNLAKELDKEE